MLMSNFLNSHNDNVNINDVILSCLAEGILVSAGCYSSGENWKLSFLPDLSMRKCQNLRWNVQLWQFLHESIVRHFFWSNRRFLCSAGNKVLTGSPRESGGIFNLYLLGNFPGKLSCALRPIYTIDEPSLGCWCFSQLSGFLKQR